MKTGTKFAAIAAFLMVGAANAATTVYSDRTAFQSTLGTSITDTYSDATYGGGFQNLSDAAMSAKFGQTTYQSTAFNNLNLITGGLYCSGCNGSFKLGFTNTSYGTSSGVFGVGADFLFNGQGDYAFVTFGDGSTQNYALAANNSFFGLTSDLGIKSIAIGAPNGASTYNSIGMDNLTIGTQAGAVPEPASWAMMVGGFGVLGGALRRRRAVNVSFA